MDIDKIIFFERHPFANFYGSKATQLYVSATER